MNHARGWEPVATCERTMLPGAPTANVEFDMALTEGRSPPGRDRHDAPATGEKGDEYNLTRTETGASVRNGAEWPATGGEWFM